MAATDLSPGVDARGCLGGSGTNLFTIDERMTMKKIMISLSMLVFSAALVSSAQAWTSWGTKDGNAHMVASADPGGWNGDTGVYQAYIRAAGSWNKQTCSNFRFTADDPALQDRN